MNARRFYSIAFDPGLQLNDTDVSAEAILVKNFILISAIVLMLWFAAPICLAQHGHGGGHGGGGHMGGGHMGGGHMGGGSFGGGHHMGGSSFGGHHIGGSSFGGGHIGGSSLSGGHHMGGSFAPSSGGHQHLGGSFSPRGASQHGAFQGSSRIQGSGSSIQHQFNFNSHSNLNPGSQLHQGSTHFGNQISPGNQHLQFQHSGTALGSRQGIQHGSTPHFGHQGQQPGSGLSHGGAAHNAFNNGSPTQHTVGKVNPLNHMGHHSGSSFPGANSNFGNHHNFQQAHQHLGNMPQGVPARHAALNNGLSHFHHGHQNGMGHGNGNWNGNGNHQSGQGHWNGRQHDWQNYHYRHYYPYYGWYSGFWNPGFGIGVGFGRNFGYGYGYGYGGYGYGGIYNSYPGWGYFGLTPWGINQQAWNFGYWNYSNPYCYGVGISPYNYAQPLIVYQQVPAGQSAGQSGVAGDFSLDTLPPGVTPEGKQNFDQALAAFRIGDSTTALDRINQAIQLMPGDAVAHEFRSLVLFSLGRYDEAAESIYAVLAVDPGWDWDTMANLYGNPQDYTNQLRALESYVGANLNSSAARFLLAYHYMRCNHNDAAADQLKHVLELTPGNKVATDLLSVIEGPEAVKNIPGATEPILPPPPERDTATPDVQAQQLHGTWNATGPDGTTFNVTLNPDATFKWTFTRNGKTEEVSGVWAVKDGTLALEPNGGGNMLGNVMLNGESKFNFRMTGAVSNDPGLNFERSTTPQ